MGSGTVTSAPARRDDRHEVWRSLLYDRLRGNARPVFRFDRTTIPAASIWTGARQWVASFREHDLDPGDRLVIDLEAGPAYVQVLVAGIWEQLTVVPVPPSEDATQVVTSLDARGRVTGQESTTREYDWVASPLAGPDREPAELRETRFTRTPSTRFAVRSSGSTGEPDWYGLSDGNVLSVLDSHADALADTEVSLSYLPWHHCFGLVLGLLYYIHQSMEVIRDPSGGQSVEQLSRLARNHSIDHFNSVPLVLERLVESGHDELIDGVSEGIVGGAPVRAPLAERLKGTNLRVGYGQTEASPGITLGSRGDFSPYYIGKPVGCEIRTTEKGELEFRGPNTHRTSFPPDEPPVRHEVPRWVSTGDLVTQGSDGLYFQGRRSDRFKLANGRFIRPNKIESLVRETFDGVAEVVLTKTDVNSFVLCVDTSTRSARDLQPLVEEEFDLLAPHLEDVLSLEAADLSRNAKGEFQRSPGQ
jgi:acyl-CoA synthetase (AMP-forming)/AMP-acid ligase II